MNAPSSDATIPHGDITDGGTSATPVLDATCAATHDAAGGEMSQAGDVLRSLQHELNRIQRSMRLTLQSKLQSLVGRSLGTLENNREVAKSIQAMLDQHGFRLRCHQCGHAAILRVSPRKGMPGGAFVFDHTIAGKRTFHGGTATVPAIQLVAKPQRKTRDEG